MKRIPLWVKLLAVIGVLAGACVGLAFVPTGEVAYAPVEPINMDGRVRVNDAAAERLQGELYLVGVTERRVNLLQRLLLDVGDPKVDFGPEPPDTPASGPAPRDVQSMDDAKRLAAAIALDLKGERVDWSGTSAVVARVAADGPAARQLQAGDILVSVNGVAVDNGVDAGKLINSRPPGTQMLFGIRRAAEPLQVRIATVAPRPTDTLITSRVGMELDTLGLKITLPANRNVEIDSGEVVGPSAGLAFALYIFDSLEDREDLLRGRHVVATGSLTPNGFVQPVGRIRQKAISAQLANRDIFLVPAANAAEAQEAVRAQCGEQAQCVRIVGVSSVKDAVAALKLNDEQLGVRLASNAAS